jgi:thiol-disulfide isomerase/thioredoxin
MSYRTEMRNDQPQIFTRRQAATLLWVPVLLTVPFLSATAGEGMLKLTVGTQPLPDTALMTQSGQPLQLADLSEQALLINFWASWCAPCIVELPALETAASQLKAESVQVILVNLDRGGAAVAQPFLDERNIQTPLSAYDPRGEWARAVQLRGLPTTLLVKPKQAEYAAHTGSAEWNSTSVLHQIRAYFR